MSVKADTTSSTAVNTSQSSAATSYSVSTGQSSSVNLHLDSQGTLTDIQAQYAYTDERGSAPSSSVSSNTTSSSGFNPFAGMSSENLSMENHYAGASNTIPTSFSVTQSSTSARTLR